MDKKKVMKLVKLIEKHIDDSEYKTKVKSYSKCFTSPYLEIPLKKEYTEMDDSNEEIKGESMVYIRLFIDVDSTGMPNCFEIHTVEIRNDRDYNKSIIAPTTLDEIDIELMSKIDNLVSKYYFIKKEECYSGERDKVIDNALEILCIN